MAVVSVNELPGVEGGVNDKFETEYTRKFQVITSSPLDGPVAVIAPTGIPRIGDPYLTSTEQDLTAIAKEIRPKQDDDNPKRWEVTVTYGRSTGDSEVPANPLQRAADISYGFAQFTRACDADV